MSQNYDSKLFKTIRYYITITIYIILVSNRNGQIA